MPETFIRPKAVALKTGHSIRSVKRKGADPADDFPSPIRLSDRVTVFIEREVDAWIDAQIAKHRGTDDAPHATPAAPNGREASETAPKRARSTGSHSTSRRAEAS